MPDGVGEPLPDQWKNYLVGYGLLQREGKVLLVGNRWRWDPRHPLVWTLPGGRAEEGETIPATARREFREETGLTAELGRLLWVAEVIDPPRRHHFVSFVFSVVATEGELCCEGDEYVVETRLVAEEALGEYLHSPTFRDPLLAYLRSPAEAPRFYLFTLSADTRTLNCVL